MAMGSLLAKVQSHTMPSPQGRWLEGKRTRVSHWLRNRRTDGMKCDWKQWRMTKLWSFEGDTTDHFKNHTYNSGNLCPCFSVSTTLKETCQLALHENHQMCQFNIKYFPILFLYAVRKTGGIIVCIEHMIPAMTHKKLSLDGILAHIHQKLKQWRSSPPLLHTKQ